MDTDSVISGFQRLARSHDAIDNESETGSTTKPIAKRALFSRFQLKTKKRLKTDERITSADFDRIIDQWMKACSVKGVSIGRMDIVTKEFSKRSKQSSDISKAKPKLELIGCGLNNESIRQLCIVLATNPLIATLDLSKNQDMTAQSVSMLEQLTESQLTACQRLQNNPVLLHVTLLSDVTIKSGTIHNSERLSENCRLLSYENARIKLRREMINQSLPDSLSTSDRVKLWHSVTDKSIKFLQSAESLQKSPRQDMMTQQETIKCVILALIKSKQLQVAPVQEEVDRLTSLRNAVTAAADDEPVEPTAYNANSVEELSISRQLSESLSTTIHATPLAQNESEMAAAPVREVNPFADMAAWLAREDSHNEPVYFGSKSTSPVHAAPTSSTHIAQQQQQEMQQEGIGDEEASEADSFFDAVHEQKQRQDTTEVDCSFGNFSADEEYRHDNEFNEHVNVESDPFAEDSVFSDEEIDGPEELFEDPFITKKHAKNDIDSQKQLFPASDSPFDDSNHDATTSAANSRLQQPPLQLVFDKDSSHTVEQASPVVLSLQAYSSQSQPPARRSTISGPIGISAAAGIASQSHHLITNSKNTANHLHSAHEKILPLGRQERETDCYIMRFDEAKVEEASNEELHYLDKRQQTMGQSIHSEDGFENNSEVSSRRSSKAKESILAPVPSQISTPAAAAALYDEDDDSILATDKTSIVNQQLDFDDEVGRYEEDEIAEVDEAEAEDADDQLPPQEQPRQYFYEEYILDFDPTLIPFSIEQQQQLLPDIDEEINYLAYLQDKIDRNRSYAASVLEEAAALSPISPAVTKASSRSSSVSPVVTRQQQQQKKRLSLVVGDRRRRIFHSSLVYGSDHLPVNTGSDDESVQQSEQRQSDASSQKNVLKLPSLSAARTLFAAVDDEECLLDSRTSLTLQQQQQQRPLHVPGSLLDSDDPLPDTNQTAGTTVASWSNRNISSWQQLPLSSSTISYDHLRELDLSHNALTSIDFGCLPANLIKLDLSHNSIASMVDLHVNCKKLKVLVLAHNQIKIIDTLPSSLLYLDISSNCISTTVVLRALSLSNKKLQFVDVSGNPIVKSSSASVSIRAFLPSLTLFHMNIKNSNHNKNSYSMVQLFAAEHWPRLRHCRATNDPVTITCFEDMKLAIQQDILRTIELSQQPLAQANSSRITAEEQRKLDHERSNYHSTSSQAEQDKYKPYDPTQDSAFLHRTKIIPEDVQSLIKRLYHDPIEAEKRKLERQQHMRNNADYAEIVRSSFAGTLRTGDNFTRIRASSFMSQRSSNATVSASNWDDSMSVGASSVRSKSTVRTSVSSLSRLSTVVGTSRLQSALPRHRLNPQFDLLDHLTSSANHSRSGRSQSATSSRKKRNSSLLKVFKAVADQSTVDIQVWEEDTNRKLGRCAILLHMLTDLAHTHSAEDGAAGGGGGLSHSTLRSMNEEWMELGFLSSDGQFLSTIDTPDFLASSTKQDSIREAIWNKLCDYRQLFSQLHDALSISIQQQLTFQPLFHGVMSGPVGKRVLGF